MIKKALCLRFRIMKIKADKMRDLCWIKTRMKQTKRFKKMIQRWL